MMALDILVKNVDWRLNGRAGFVEPTFDAHSERARRRDLPGYIARIMQLETSSSRNVPKLRRAPQQHAAAFRGKDEIVADHLGQLERDKFFERESILCSLL